MFLFLITFTIRQQCIIPGNFPLTHCVLHWKHAEGMSLRYGVALYGLSGKLQGAMIMHCCRIVNGLKNKKHKKQPWGNVECFAFGGATVRFASLETSFHAANHTIPPPPSNEGYPRCPKDKNRSPLHGEKLLMIK